MPIECTAPRMALSGNGHKYIALLWWKDDQTGATGSSTRETMVAYVKKNGNESVWWPDKSGRPSAWVHVNNNNGRVEYVQTFADCLWTNNLLSVPLG